MSLASTLTCIVITGIPSTSIDREQLWAAIKDLMIELWVMRHNARVWNPEIAVLNGARAIPTDEDPWGQEEEGVPDPGPPPLNMHEVQRVVTAELNAYMLHSLLHINHTYVHTQRTSLVATTFSDQFSVSDCSTTSTRDILHRS